MEVMEMEDGRGSFWDKMEPKAAQDPLAEQSRGEEADQSSRQEERSERSQADGAGLSSSTDRMDSEDQDRMRLEMDSLSRNEEFARVVVAVFMSRLDPTLEEIDDVKTAVSEAVTNAIIHGYGPKRGIVYIGASVVGNELTVTVEDKGVGILDLKKAMEPMYTSDKSGERSGMGFSFMEAFMDKLEVESQPGKGTTVRMKKRIGG